MVGVEGKAAEVGEGQTEKDLNAKPANGYLTFRQQEANKEFFRQESDYGQVCETTMLVV